MLVDVHCHIVFDHFSKDLDEVITRAKNFGVIAIVVSGVNHSTNMQVLELAKKHDIVKPSLGIYPLDAVGLGFKDDVMRDVEKIDVDEEIEFIRKNKEKIIAIGEIGLDNSVEDSRLEEQKIAFRKGIRLGKEIQKPIVIHTRKAEKECIDVLEEEKAEKVVLHCFTGNLKLAKRAEQLGYSFSIPSVITRLKHFQELVGRVSLNNLLTETDAPYLGYVKGERSEPSHIKETIKIIAKIKNMEETEVEKIIFSNYQKIFLTRIK